MSARVEQFKDMARQARRDLFDQSHPIGRLSLLQCAMLGGGTLVTISLAGSLFFSISPDEADHKVLLYLLFTLAPFAIVSPLLGPLIDKSRGARRAMCMTSAVGQAVLCPLMAMHIHGLLLFPLAFLVLVFQKLYLVTKGALVPEMAALSAPDEETGEQAGYAPLNARLTLLGTLAGFAVSAPGAILYAIAKSEGVLILATIVFVGAAVAAARLPVISGRRAERLWTDQETRAREYGSEGEALARERDLMSLQPIANPEVMLGLTAMCIVRGLTGFMTFMLAFGLRRSHAGLYWYGLVLGATGIGAIVGLVLVGRLRKRLSEQQLLLSSLWLIAATAGGVALWGTLFAQVVLGLMVGLCGAIAQPSFDSMTQRYIPLSAQGRAFARFGMRQQLVWVVGSLIPVIISFSLPQGDATMAVLAALGGLSYVSGRRAAQATRVLRNVRDLGDGGRGNGGRSRNRRVRDVGEFGGSAGA
jgi:MFS-type transporter involved in bile tolerance (Atg22 family)